MRLLAILLFATCLNSAALQAQSVVPSFGCFPLEAQFSPPDNGPAYWDFDDGVSSTLSSPSHVYTRAGVFNVKFRRSINGPVVGTVVVTVYPQPVLNLAIDTATGCVPHEAKFGVTVSIDPAITITDFTWAFGDGATAMGDTTRHTYRAANEFDVTIRMQTNLTTCNVTQVFAKAIKVKALPIADFTTDPSPALSCDLPLTVRVTDKSTGAAPLGYNWNFGNGQTSSSKTPLPVTYTNKGSYPLSLTVRDANGCVGIKSVPVSAGGPDANFSLPDTVCFGVEYRIDALGAADSFSYTFGPGIDVLEGDGSVQFVSFTQKGFTTVGLAVFSDLGNCATDTVRNIFVQRVDVKATIDPPYACTNPYDLRVRVNSPDGIARWIVENDPVKSFVSRDTTITLQYDEGGVYGQNWHEFTGATVIVRSPQGCVGDTTIYMDTDVPNALFIPDKHYGCAPLLVTFADSVRSSQTVTSYVINWGDGQTETFTQPGPWPHTYTAAGEYLANIAITNTAGCTDTSYSIPIQVGVPIGNLTYTSDVQGTCVGDTINFLSTTSDPRIDNIHFEIEGGPSYHCAKDPLLRHVIEGSITGNTLNGVYYVEYNGCIDSVNISIPYQPVAYAEVDYSIECETPFDVTFFNRSTASVSDSLFVIGITDTTFRQNLVFGPSDSLRLTMPARGAYLGVLSSEGTSLRCGASLDTVTFYITVPEAKFEIPEMFCSGLPLNLDGSASQDVNATCFKGYQWDLSWDRPYVTSDPILDDSEILANARGDQYVELIVEDINGCVDTTRRNIELFATIPTITADKSKICLPADVAFILGIESDTTVVSFEWDFGGLGTSTERNPSFSFPNVRIDSGFLSILVLTQDVLGCPGVGVYELEIYRPVSEVITQPSPPNICVGNSVRFEASDFTREGSNLRFNWDFGNGQTSQNRIENIVYNSTGSFPVTLNYSEVSSGCAGDTTLTVVVEQAPVPNFTSDIDGQTIVCYPSIVTFTDASSSTVPFTSIWSVNGIIGAGPEFVTTLGRGVNEVTLTTVTNLSGCASTTTRSFNLAGPAGDFAFSPSTICVGERVTFTLQDTIDVESWTWDFGNGQTQQGGNPASAVYTFRPPSGFTVVSLTLRSQSSECTFTVVDTLRFDAVFADFSTSLANEVACEPSVQLIDQSQGATRYLYTFPGGSTSTQRSPTFNFPGPGTYQVRLQVESDDGICKGDTTKTITVLPDLIPMVSVVPACPNEAATITVSASRPLSIVEITPPGIVATQRGGVFTTVPLSAAQTISVTAVDTFGCEAIATNVQVEIGTQYSGTGDTIVIFAGTSTDINIPNVDGFNIRWLDPQQVGCASCNNPNVSPTVTTDYGVVISDVGGCSEITLIFRIIVAEEPIVPNLFTPNNDGRNDSWAPLFPEGLRPEVEIYQVFSRWGSLVFDSDDSSESWKGDNNGGGDAPSDVYTYVVKFVYGNGTTFNKSGEVTLLR